MLAPGATLADRDDPSGRARRHVRRGDRRASDHATTGTASAKRCRSASTPCITSGGRSRTTCRRCSRAGFALGDLREVPGPSGKLPLYLDLLLTPSSDERRLAAAEGERVLEPVERDAKADQLLERAGELLPRAVERLDAGRPSRRGAR